MKDYAWRVSNDEFRTLKKDFFDHTERKRLLKEKLKDFEERINKLSQALDKTNGRYKEAIQVSQDEDLYEEK